MPRKRRRKVTAAGTVNWKGVFMAVLVASAHFLGVANALGQNSGVPSPARREKTASSKNSNKAIDDSKQSSTTAKIVELFKSVCTNVPFKSGNKPTMRVNSWLGGTVTENCIGILEKGKKLGDDLRCVNDITEFNRQMNEEVPERKKNVTEMRHHSNKLFQEKHEQINNDKKPVLLTLSEVEKEQFDNVLGFLKKLVSYKIRREQATIRGAGNCQEFTEATEVDLIKLFHKEKLPLTMHKVILFNTDSESHVFHIVGGDPNQTNEIVINNNRTAVGEWIKRTVGYICDRWNEGYFKETSNNKNYLYINRYHSLKMGKSTTELNYNNLSRRAITFLDDQFRDLGFDIPRQSSSDEDFIESEEKQTQYKMEL